VAATFRAAVTAEWIEGSPAVVNDATATARLRTVAERAVGAAGSAEVELRQQLAESVAEREAMLERICQHEADEAAARGLASEQAAEIERVSARVQVRARARGAMTRRYCCFDGWLPCARIACVYSSARGDRHHGCLRSVAGIPRRCGMRPNPHGYIRLGPTLTLVPVPAVGPRFS
jgi:hypothetical protein